VLAVAVALVAGWVVLLDMLLTPDWIDGAWVAWLLEAALVLGAAALLYGALHLAATHASRLAAREEPRAGGVVLVTGLTVTLFLGVAAPGSPALNWVFRYLYTPLQATMLGLMTFVLLDAAYRAAHIGRRGARALIVASAGVLLLQVLANGALPLVPGLRDWLLAVPVTGAMRGILLGVALGSTAAGLRVLFAVERPYTSDATYAHGDPRP
jgi:hypothetical protein